MVKKELVNIEIELHYDDDHNSPVNGFHVDLGLGKIQFDEFDMSP
jgi:hypothetical protein